MKNITNILSYLWLLMLLMVTACSDLEEITTPMQGEEEVELTIKTNVPSLGGSTRSVVDAENITSITALAFDSDKELVKVVQAALTDQITTSTIEDESYSTKGKMTIKVPVRTRRIHFIAKNDATFDVFSTVNDYGKSEETLLKDLTSTELHYWGMLEFADAEDMDDLSDELTTAPNRNDSLILIRNMAKLTLETSSDDDYIAGLLNYNVKGTIVPYKDGELRYQTTTNHDLPTKFDIASDATEKNLGKKHYMFEEFNDTIGGITDLVYAICKISNKYYKIALKSPSKYHYIIRNQVYNIKIAGTLDETLGKSDYTEAVVNGKPINDITKEKVYITVIPDEETTFLVGTTDDGDSRVSMYLGEIGKVKVIIPEGITELQIGYSSTNFEPGGVTVTTETVGKIGETATNGNVYVDTYDLTSLGETREIDLSIALMSSIKDAIEGLQIQFKGTGELKQSDDKLVVDVIKHDDLNVNPKTVELPKSADSEFEVSVTIPHFDNTDDSFKLKVEDVENKFNITAPQDLQLVEDANGNYYEVTEGSYHTFTFALKEDGTIGDEHTINFTATSSHHELTGITTVTLIDDAVPDQDSYEIWVGDGSTWTGTDYAVEFFGYNETTPEGSFAAGTTPDDLRKEFYDKGANDHCTTPMLMGSDDSFTFTIPAGDNRWLTMLVAADGKDGNNTPSINLLKDDKAYTTETAEALANGTYNFGAEDEIGTAGRLIRYELEPGTYTLQGSSAEYLLYYMRVSKARPEMTDVAQPLLTDYTLSWSGGAYANTTGKGYLKISDSKHIVDEDNLTHTVSLEDGNSLAISGGESTFDLYITQPTYTFVEPNDDNNNNGSITIGNDNLDEYKDIVPSSELRLENNGGDYVLSGKIIEPAYKYSAFYDVLQLNQVEYEVKNPIVPALYNSMDGDKLTPVENWTTMDDAWAIGFFMPSPMPIEYASDSDRPAIAISIPDWTKSDSGTSSGLGVVVDSENKIYTLTTQDNSVHPRPGWTYKIQWADRASSTISPEIVDKSSDVYFTYMGDIAKKVDVDVPEIEETSLNITLDFYAENGVDFNNLTFGETEFYLKATLSQAIPEGRKIYLNLETTGDREKINESGSYNESSSEGISYRYTEGKVDGLVITAAKDKTEYKMCWTYVRSSAEATDDVNIQYAVSSDKHTLTNERQASITIKNEQAATNGEILVSSYYTATPASNISISLEYGEDSTEEFTVDVTVPAGVTQLNIAAEDFDVTWGDKKYANAVNGSYDFSSSNAQTTRFKFTLKDGISTNTSTITFSSDNVASATVTVNLSARNSEPSGGTTIWNGAMQMNWDWGLNYLSVAKQIPIGSTVTLNFTTTGGSFKLHDVTGGADVIALPDIDYGSNAGIISVNSGVTSYSFDVTNYITVNSIAITEYLDGLKINGENVTMTSIVVKYPVIYCNFSGTNPVYGWDTTYEGVEVTDATITVEGGTLRLTNQHVNTNNGVLASLSQAAVDVSFEQGKAYTLTFKVRADVDVVNNNDGLAAEIPINFQDEDGDQWPNYGNFKTNESENVQISTDWKTVTLTTTATGTPTTKGRIVFSFGHLVGTIYIDDLKLVRNNQ